MIPDSDKRSSIRIFDGCTRRRNTPFTCHRSFGPVTKSILGRPPEPISHHTVDPHRSDASTSGYKSKVTTYAHGLSLGLQLQSNDPPHESLARRGMDRWRSPKIWYRVPDAIRIDRVGPPLNGFRTSLFRLTQNIGELAARQSQTRAGPTTAS